MKVGQDERAQVKDGGQLRKMLDGAFSKNKKSTQTEVSLTDPPLYKPEIQCSIRT